MFETTTKSPPEPQMASTGALINYNNYNNSLISLAVEYKRQHMA